MNQIYTFLYQGGFITSILLLIISILTTGNTSYGASLAGLLLVFVCLLAYGVMFRLYMPVLSVLSSVLMVLVLFINKKEAVSSEYISITSYKTVYVLLLMAVIYVLYTMKGSVVMFNLVYLFALLMWADVYVMHTVLHYYLTDGFRV